MDSSLQSKSQKKINYSTPKHDGVEIDCTLSSISGSSSESLSRKTRFVPTSVYTITRDDNERISAEKYQNHEKGSKGIIGDVIREEIARPPDIRPDDLDPLFCRPKLYNNDDFITSLTLSVPGGSLLSAKDSLFTVGEHYFTYARNPCREVVASPLKINRFLNRKANLLWEDFIGDNSPRVFCKKKKHVNCFLKESDYKFFKSKQKRVQDGENANESVPKKKKKVNIGFKVNKISTPSLTRPLGWMAIKGLGIAERLKVCDEYINSFEQYKSRSNIQKNYASEKPPSAISSDNEENKSNEYPSPILGENERYQSDEYSSSIPNNNKENKSDEYSSLHE